MQPQNKIIYKMKSAVFKILLLYTFYCSFSSATTLDKLLPTKDANKVFLEFSQDGRIINFKIINNSPMVLTGGLIKCHAQETIDERSRQGCENLFDADLSDSMRKLGANERSISEYKNRGRHLSEKCAPRTDLVSSEINIKPISDKLLPDAFRFEYGELPSIKIVRSCAISEPRGRSTYWFEIR